MKSDEDTESAAILISQLSKLSLMCAPHFYLHLRVNTQTTERNQLFRNQNLSLFLSTKLGQGAAWTQISQLFALSK